MTSSWHVVAKLLTVSRMSKVDYQKKICIPIWSNKIKIQFVQLYKRAKNMERLNMLVRTEKDVKFAVTPLAIVLETLMWLR